MKTYAGSSEKGLMALTVMAGVIGGLGLAVTMGAAEMHIFLARAGLGFAIAWWLAYLTVKG